jgi:hypothetical protein
MGHAATAESPSRNDGIGGLRKKMAHRSVDQCATPGGNAEKLI